MTNNLTDDLKRLMMAGVGAFSTAAEKTKDVIDELSQKGGETAQKTREFIDEMAKKGEETLERNKETTDNLKGFFEKIKREAAQLSPDEIVSSLNGLTDDALTKLRDSLDALINRRADEPADECGCGCGCEDEEKPDDTPQA
jgi:polyhydroxyalkanoate synthesis regulator phasin